MGQPSGAGLYARPLPAIVVLFTHPRRTRKMDQSRVVKALAQSVAELCRAYLDLKSLPEGEAAMFDLGRAHVLGEQLEVLARELEDNELSMLADELRGVVEPDDAGSAG
jgi:hypothetical protein